jgi:hypothetical protein
MLISLICCVLQKAKSRPSIRKNQRKFSSWSVDFFTQGDFWGLSFVFSLQRRAFVGGLWVTSFLYFLTLSTDKIDYFFNFVG